MFGECTLVFLPAFCFALPLRTRDQSRMPGTGSCKAFALLLLPSVDWAAPAMISCAALLLSLRVATSTAKAFFELGELIFWQRSRKATNKAIRPKLLSNIPDHGIDAVAAMVLLALCRYLWCHGGMGKDVLFSGLCRDVKYLTRPWLLGQEARALQIAWQALSSQFHPRSQPTLRQLVPIPLASMQQQQATNCWSERRLVPQQPGALQFLRWLAQKGHPSPLVLTPAPTGFARAPLENLILNDYVWTNPCWECSCNCKGWRNDSFYRYPILWGYCHVLTH